MICGYKISSVSALYSCLASDISYDGETATVSSAADLGCKSVEISSKSTLADRYTYEKEINAVFDGRVIPQLEGKRLIVADKGGNTFILDAEFDAAVSWQYSLSDEADSTTWTLELDANMQIIPCSITSLAPSDGCGYSTVGTVEATLFPKASAIFDIDNSLVMSEVTVKPEGKVSFGESYSEGVYEATVRCEVALSADNVLMADGLQNFMLYRHVADVAFGGGHYIAGLEHGMDCQVDIQASGEEGSATLTFRDVSTEPSPLLQTLTVTGGEDIFYNYVKYAADGTQGFDCGGDGTAFYTLQRGYYQDGTATDLYKAYNGYENSFPTLNIKGVFYSLVSFEDTSCLPQSTITTTLPPSYTFTASAQTFSGTITSSNSWEATSIPAFVSLSTSTGSAGTTSLTVTSTGASMAVGNLVITDTDGNTQTMYITLQPSEITLTPSTHDANAFTLYITSSGVIPSLVSSPNESVTNQLTENTWEASVTANDSTSDRTLTWTFSRAGSSVTVSATQQGCSVKWVDTGNTICDGTSLYGEERKYVSYDGINWSMTSEVRLGSLIEANSYFCPS